MNVVPVHLPDTLPIIFDRGLIGFYHDWCESLSTYPRTYDLLHSSFLFGSLSQRYIDVFLHSHKKNYSFFWHLSETLSLKFNEYNLYCITAYRYLFMFTTCGEVNNVGLKSSFFSDATL